MRLSVLIPARDEEGSIVATVERVVSVLEDEVADFEVLVVDDSSSDGTRLAAERLARDDGRVRCLASPYPNGYGFTVRAGLERFDGDAVAVLMGDGSDDPRDLVAYLRILEEGHDCAFGSRFVPGASVIGYPKLKLALNRVVNFGIGVLFRYRYNDTTNAFKAYRREVIESIQPLLSNHFNLTVEMPLKAIIRGHSYEVAPISWTNRDAGESKLALKEMGSRYLFIVLYAFLEAHLSAGDYRRPAARRTGRSERRSA